MGQSHIPKEKYKFDEHLGHYVTFAQVDAHHTPDEYERFKQWMGGQTCGWRDNQAAIYADDYERWVRQGQHTEQGKDWD